MQPWRDALLKGGRWQTGLVLFAAGALLSLAFAPFYYWPLLFLSLPILYLLLTSCDSVRQSLWRGFSFGYGFFMAGTWWIGNALLVDAEAFGWLLPFSILGLSAAMALWFMLLGWLIFCFRRTMNPLQFAALWLLVEVGRSLGMFAFPWNLLGYVSLVSLPFAQVAAYVEVYGLSLLIAWVALMPIYWLSAPNKQAIRASVVATLLVAGCFVYGHNQLRAPTQFTSTKLRLVQPDIPQEVKGTLEGQEVAATLLTELNEKPVVGAPIDVTIWPESAYPFAVRTGVSHPLPQVKGVLLTGAVRIEGERPHRQVWNSLVAMDDGGQVLASYDKAQLVPFGEFVPFRTVLPLKKITPGDTDFSRGIGPRTLRIAGIPPFSPQVCYEGIFSKLAIDTHNHPQWMLNVTNDAWYGFTAGPYQHFDMVRMRSIEQRMPMVRVANNGISAVIDAQGRVVEQLPLGTRGAVDVLLPRASRM